MYCRMISLASFRLLSALRIAVETTPSILLTANFRSCVPSLFLAGSATAMAAAWNVTDAPLSVTAVISSKFSTSQYSCPPTVIWSVLKRISLPPLA
ncbi:hypothetical protein D3C75_901260 [compost metagenome]